MKIRQPEEQAVQAEAEAEVEVSCFPEEVAGHFPEVAVVAVRQSCVLP